MSPKNIGVYLLSWCDAINKEKGSDELWPCMDKFDIIGIFGHLK